MSASYFGIYRAKHTQLANTKMLVLVPQVLADLEVPLEGFIGPRPPVGSRGVVSFLGGDPAYPVWMGTII